MPKTASSRKKAPTSKSSKQPFSERQKELIRRLRLEMVERHIETKDLAVLLEISYSHATGILSGDRWVGGCDRKTIELIASFLRVPVVQVYFWSDFLKIEDAILTYGLKERLALTLRKMERDPAMAMIAPSQENWDKTPDQVKLSMTLLYEAYASESLLEHARMELPESYSDVVKATRGRRV